MSLNSKMTALASSIRTKSGVSSLLSIGGMKSAVDSIETGITPSGTISITQNGTYDVTSKEEAIVNVACNPNIFFLTEVIAAAASDIPIGDVISAANYHCKYNTSMLVIFSFGQNTPTTGSRTLNFVRLWHTGQTFTNGSYIYVSGKYPPSVFTTPVTTTRTYANSSDSTLDETGLLINESLSANPFCATGNSAAILEIPVDNTMSIIDLTPWEDE